MEEYDADTLIDGIWFDTGSTIKRDYERVEKDCREALYPGCIGVTEKALDKMSFWQKIKIVGRHSLQKILLILWFEPAFDFCQSVVLVLV